ncbi:hypothetical protein ACNQGB_20875, partial [Flavobacterium sp. XS1P32]|uniref:hypothetical protein n=1 Tax=Flavobacterium sp. XS1P32 TaxID=3401726 RepID=UPI003AAA528B
KTLNNLFESASHSVFLHVFPLGYLLCIAISGRDNNSNKKALRIIVVLFFNQVVTLYSFL